MLAQVFRNRNLDQSGPRPPLGGSCYRSIIHPKFTRCGVDHRLHRSFHVLKFGDSLPGREVLERTAAYQFLLCVDISDILGLKRSDDAALAFLIVEIAAVELLALIL
jgi:hypothetical protein